MNKNKDKGWHVYGIGIVAAPKPSNSNVIQVTPREKMAYSSGKLELNPQKIDYKGNDANNNPVEDSVITNTTIEATWYPGRSNRMTAPNVRKGERVEILRYSDEPTFYWRETGLDDNLRRLDDTVYAYSASPNVNDNETRTPDNSYHFEISPTNGFISVITAKQNGETVAYTIKVDGKQGQITIADDIDNSILIDSLNHHITMTTTEGTTVELNATDIYIRAVDKLDIEAQDTTITCKSLDINVEQDFNLTVGGKITMKSTGETDIEGSKVNVNGTEGGSFNGSTLDPNGIMEVSDIKVDGISSKSHIHNTPDGDSGPPKPGS